MSVYDELNVKTYINAMATVNPYGDGLMSEAVLSAMQEASQSFVSINDLHQKVGSHLAKLTGNQSCLVVAGVTSGLLLCADALSQSSCEPKDEIIYLKEQETLFKQIISLSNAKGVVCPADLTQLQSKITPQTRAIFYSTSYAYPKLTFEQLAQEAKKYGLHFIVQASLPPKENLSKYTNAGASAVVFAGGRGIKGPSCSGLVVGQEQLISQMRNTMCKKHGISTLARIGREEIVGLCVAVEELLTSTNQTQILAQINSSIRQAKHEIEDEGYFLCHTSKNDAVPRLVLEILGSYSSESLVDMLKEGEPSVLVERTSKPDCANGIYINLSLLNENEVSTVFEQVRLCAEELTI